MKSEVIAVGTTPVLLRAAQPEPETIYLYCGDKDTHLGDSAVTSSTGLPLTKTVINPIYIRGGQTLYAVAAAGSHNVILLVESP